MVGQTKYQNVPTMPSAAAEMAIAQAATGGDGGSSDGDDSHDYVNVSKGGGAVSGGEGGGNKRDYVNMQWLDGVVTAEELARAWPAHFTTGLDRKGAAAQLVGKRHGAFLVRPSRKEASAATGGAGAAPG